MISACPAEEGGASAPVPEHLKAWKTPGGNVVDLVSFFAMSSPKRSLRTSTSPLKTLREKETASSLTGHFFLSLEASRKSEGVDIKSGEFFVRQHAVDCGRMPKRLTGADSPKLAGKSTGVSLATPWRRR